MDEKEVSISPAEQGISPTKRGKKRGCCYGCLIVAGIFLIIIVIAVILAPKYINIDQYRDRVAEMLSEELDREVEIGEIDLSLFGGISVTATDFRIKDPRIDGEFIIRAPSIRVKIAPLSILFNRADVKHIILREPEIHIIEYTDGTLNTDGMGEGTARVAPDDIDLNTVLIHHDNTPYTILTSYSQPRPNPRDLCGTNTPVRPPASLSSGYIPDSDNYIQGDGSDFLSIDTILIKTIDVEGGSFTFSREQADGVLLGLVSISGIDFEISSIVIPEINSIESDSDLLNSISADIAIEVLGGDIFATRFSDLSVDLSAEGGMVTLEGADASVFGGSVSSEGVFGLAGEAPSGKMEVNVSNIRINELLNAISDEKDLIVGILNLTGNYMAPLNNQDELIRGLTGRGNVSVTEGYISDFSLRKELARALGIPPELLPQELETGDFDYMGGGYYIASERIYTNDFETRAPTFDATTSGYMGFDETLDFSGEIYLKDAIKELPLFKNTTGILGIEGQLDVIPYRISGTLDNVKFSISDFIISQGRLSNLLESFGVDTGENKEDIDGIGNIILDEIFK